jgi:anti-anti-sigma factor
MRMIESGSAVREAGGAEGTGGVSVLQPRGPLRAPVRPELRRQVEELLARGRRSILLDLATLTELDAAGVGELVRLYGMANAAQGELWIENAPRGIRTLLDRAGLLDILSGSPAAPAVA